MLKNRKTVKGKLGNTRPKDTDFAGIARKQNRKKKTTTKTVKSNRPTSSKVKTNRAVLKEKQKLAGKGLGQAGQAFLGGMGRQTPTKTKKTKRVIDRAVRRAEPTKKAKVRKAMDKIAIGDQYGRPFGMKAGGKTSKYRMAGGGKTSKYRMAGGGKTSKTRMAGGGKTSKYRMKGGGKTSKYMAKGGKTSKYMARGGRAR